MRRSGLALVAAHDLGLDLDRAREHGHERGLLEREQRLGVALERREQLGVPDRGLLDHLGEAGRALARRQRAQRLDVDRHEARLVERADQVLALAQVHARLAADARVDHREQRRRHLDERDPAQIGRRREAGEIAHHAAAERDERAVAVGARAQQLVIERARPGAGSCSRRRRARRCARCARPAARSERSARAA